MIPLDPLTKGKLTPSKPLFTRYQAEPDNEGMRSIFNKAEPFENGCSFVVINYKFI
jgi:hypothetical protein